MVLSAAAPADAFTKSRRETRRLSLAVVCKALLGLVGGLVGDLMVSGCVEFIGT